MKILCVIPARYSSSRFPGKPLANIGDQPMIQWVYDAVVSSRLFSTVVVATDDSRIATCVSGFNGNFEYTQSCHVSGSDRVAEVAARYQDHDIVVNVQGDQPFVTAEMLQSLVSPYLSGDMPDMTTVACPLSLEMENDPNCVKVLYDKQGYAIYFSRSPVPHYRSRQVAPVGQHVGLYAFTSQFLRVYTSLPPTQLEICEQLEQLRALEHGHRIRVSLISSAVIEVNSPDDLTRANHVLMTMGEGRC